MTHFSAGDGCWGLPIKGDVLNRRAKAGRVPAAVQPDCARRPLRSVSGGRGHGVRAVLCFVMAAVLICSPAGAFSIPGSQNDGNASAYAAGSSSSSSDSASEASPTIDLAMIYHDGKIVGTSSAPDQKDLSITQKGGTLEFYSRVQWSDYSKEYNSDHVTWSTSNTSVATINSSGVLTAVGNGTVKVIATVGAKYSGTGKALKATVTVRVANQTDERYVTAIRIVDADGNAIKGNVFSMKQSLSTAKAQFYADVDVYDPATGSKHTYSTKDGKLSSQVKGLSDVSWYMSDTTMGAVDEDTGLFRPSVYGTMVVNAKSAAGKDNKTVKASVTVTAKDPDGGTVNEDYHPQDTLTVKVYYEKYPPADFDDDSAKEWVTTKTYSVDDLESLGTVTATYTALGGGSYYTITGTGTPLATVLKNAGVNLKGVKRLSFKTADSLDRPVSYSYIVGSDRYYFPNIDIGSYSGAKQVYPILALESSETKNGSTDPDYHLTDATRFRLLFGSTGRSDHSSQYQIKWINTLYVELKGGPKAQNGSGSTSGKTHSGSGKSSGGKKSSVAGGSSSSSQSGSSSSSSGTGGSGGAVAGDANGSGGSGNDSAGAGAAGAAGSAGSTDASDGQDGAGDAGNQGSSDKADTGANGVGGDGDKGDAGSFSVYQVMNRNDSDTQNTIDADNPWRRAVLPAGCLFLCLGGLESWLWYRWQTKPTRMA